MKKIVLYAIINVIFFFFIIIFSALISIFPKRFYSKVSPADFNLIYENVTITTEDNIKISAWLIRQKSDKVIIVGHGYPFDKGNVLGFAEFLHEKYNLLFFDFRGFGQSTGKFKAGIKETNDLNSAVEYLKKRGFKNIGALGFSLSASVFLVANNPDVKAIVAESPYANLEMVVRSMYRQFYFLKEPFVYFTDLLAKLVFKKHLREIGPLNNIKGIKAKVLLIHGKKDSQLSYENSMMLKEANPSIELWLLEDVDHGQAHFVLGKEYEKKVLDFFENNLK